MMIRFHSITRQEGTIIPIPKQFKKVHLPFLESNCVAFKEGIVFQQNWQNIYQSEEICFIHAHIYEPVTFIITALNPPITVAIYCYQGSFETREKLEGTILTKPEQSFYVKQISPEKNKAFIHFIRPGNYSIIYVSLHAEKLKLLQKQYILLKDPEVIRGRKLFKGGRILKQTVEELFQHKYGSAAEINLYGEALVVQIYSALLSILTIQNTDWSVITIKDRIAWLMEFIKDNLNYELTLENLSEMLYLTKEALRKSFKVHSGTNLTKYIQTVRIESACKLLFQYPDKSIQEVAEEVGYSSRQGLDKAFRQVLHTTPENYRSQHK